MSENNFLCVKNKLMFLDELLSNNVPETTIAFIEDTREIWTHGTFYATIDVANPSEVNDICNSIFNSGYYGATYYETSVIGEFETTSE